jgi:hypothetical protein
MVTRSRASRSGDSSPTHKVGSLLVVVVMSCLLLGNGPTSAATAKLTKEQTGAAIATACETLSRRLFPIQMSYAGLSIETPPSTWKLYFSELIREQKNFEASLQKIRPAVGGDGGITAQILKLAHSRLVQLEAIQKLLKSGRIAQALAQKSLLPDDWLSAAPELVDLMARFDYECVYLQTSTTPPDPVSIDARFFPDIPGYKWGEVTGAEKVWLSSLQSQKSTSYTGVEARRLLATDGSNSGLVIVYPLRSVVGREPTNFALLTQLTVRSIAGIAKDPVAGFSLYFGKQSTSDQATAFRPDVVVSATVASSPQQTLLSDLVTAILRAMPPSVI